jgi:hypothetical protein
VPTVNFDFLDRRSAERFAELLDETDGRQRSAGRHGGSGSRGQADEGLAELVAIGHTLSATRPGVQVDPEFRVGLRAMLVATAERDGIGVTATRTETEPGGHAARESKRGLFGRAAGRRIRARGAIVIGVAAGAMAVSGISAASENATPGDALYGVKRSTEKAQLAMAGSDVTRGQLSLDFARNRLTEAAALGGSSDFAAVLDDMDRDTRQGVKLLTSSAVDRSDPAPLNTVDGFVTKQRSVLAPVAEKATAANQTRANESLALLKAVENRTESLRDGLKCDPPRRDGVDVLGPKLDDCRTGADSQEPEAKEPGQSGKQNTKSGSTDKDKKSKADPDKTGPAVAPDPTTGEVDDPDGENPARTTTTPADEAPTNGTTTAPADPGQQQQQEEDGLLGGLLGGIFG